MTVAGGNGDWPHRPSATESSGSDLYRSVGKHAEVDLILVVEQIGANVSSTYRLGWTPFQIR